MLIFKLKCVYDYLVSGRKEETEISRLMMKFWCSLWNDKKVWGWRRELIKILHDGKRRRRRNNRYRRRTTPSDMTWKTSERDGGKTHLVIYKVFISKEAKKKGAHETLIWKFIHCLTLAHFSLSCLIKMPSIFKCGKSRRTTRTEWNVGTLDASIEGVRLMMKLFRERKKNAKRKTIC